MLLHRQRIQRIGAVGSHYSLLNLSRVLGGPLVFAIPRDNLQRIEKPTMRARARSLAPLKTIESIETIET